jgi:hypothetical protein
VSEITKATHPLMFTEDDVEITPGARLFNYYDGWWGYVDPEAWDPTRHNANGLAPDGEYFSGWFELVREREVVKDADGNVDWKATKAKGARGTLLNGERMASYKPSWMKGES